MRGSHSPKQKKKRIRPNVVRIGPERILLTAIFRFPLIMKKAEGVVRTFDKQCRVGLYGYIFYSGMQKPKKISSR